MNNDNRLAGRTAIVTGSSAGIGKAIAMTLAASGAEVIVTARDQGRASVVAEAIAASGGKAHALTFDAAGTAQAIQGFAQQALAMLNGRVDILVNNAGIYPAGATHELDFDTVNAVLDTNVRGLFLLVAALGPVMAAQGGGSIVNISSWTTDLGNPHNVLYPATKAAVEGLTRGWAAEFGSRGVRVNNVSPGVVPSRGTIGREDVVEAAARMSPIGVPVPASAVGDAVRYLVSDEAFYVNGATLDVDGGIRHARI